MEPQTLAPTPQNEAHIPWYVIIGVMLVATAIIIVIFSGPLNTSPDQKYEHPTAQAK